MINRLTDHKDDASPGLELEALRACASRLRGRIISLSHARKAPHLGSCLSCVDILVAAYWTALDINPACPDDPKRDRFILSKGHAALALYCTLAERGILDEELLNTFNTSGTKLPEHPAAGGIPGIEAATGSLGHGLPIGVGLALGARIRQEGFRTVVVLSDGECNEGSVWEAALMAAAQGLDRLTAVVDYNKWQATGRSNEVLGLAPLAEKWRSFGWNVIELDGHDMAALKSGFAEAENHNGKPTVLIAHTIKGKGVSFMEDDNNWHYRIPTADEVKNACIELGLS